MVCFIYFLEEEEEEEEEEIVRLWLFLWFARKVCTRFFSLFYTLFVCLSPNYPVPSFFFPDNRVVVDL